MKNTLNCLVATSIVLFGVIAVGCGDDDDSASPNASGGSGSGATAGNGGGGAGGNSGSGGTAGSTGATGGSAGNSGTAGSGGSNSCELTTDIDNALDFGPLEIGKYNPDYLVGVEVEAVPCGSVPANDEGNGWIHPPHPGIPFYYKLTHADYLPSLSMEFQVGLNQGGTFAQSKHMVLVPTAKIDEILPGYDAAKASAVVNIEEYGFTCGAGGYTVTLNDHPEATITYWTNTPDSGGMPDPTLTAMPDSGDGYVSITGINPGPLGPFTLTAAGTDCVPSISSPFPDGRTGNVPLEAGSVSVVDLFGN